MAINLFRTKIIPEDQIVYVYDLVKNIVAPGERAFVSPYIQQTIDGIIGKRLPGNWEDDKGFINKLTKSFRQKNFSTYGGKHFPDYYAAYYLPNNLYKIQLMFLELFRLGRISFSERKIRVLDIGTAVGTTAWALYDFYDILTNVLRLYGLKDEQLPILEVDGIEKYQSNIEFFNLVREEIKGSGKSKVHVNEPIEADVLENGLSKVTIKKYDVVIASNIISEFPSYKHQVDFSNNIVNGLKKSASFVIVETAMLKDTRSLKKIQYELTQRKDIQVISPCGKVGGFSERCTNCYSFRRENLKIPETMKLFSKYIDDSDENEKLKWSYTIYTKDGEGTSQIQNGYAPLQQVLTNDDKAGVSALVEIVSGRMYKDGDADHYYLKVCDQSEPKEQFILKVLKYYELQKYHFGDRFEIKHAKIEPIQWARPRSIKFALVIDPRVTLIDNIEPLNEPRGLVPFKDIDETNILYFLKRFFQFYKFHEGQFEILQKVLRNENVLGILATGGGKSLTYQLPALLKPGLSIIISPLKSLMDDQVHGMKNRFGFDFVDRIHSGIPLKEKEGIFQRFKNGRLKILYVAPERLQQKTFQQELKRLIDKGININYFPIDEAHCISEWGHDFRPSYARLKERQKDLSHVDGSQPSIIALTATASRKVREDVLEQLSLDEKKDLYHKIIDRKELSLEVIPMEYDTGTGGYEIRYRDLSNKTKFSKHTFKPASMRHEVLEYVLKDILPRRFDSFDIKQDPGLIFTIYADPQPAEEMAAKKIKKMDKELVAGTEDFKKILKSKAGEIFRSDKCREGEGAQWISGYLNKKGIKNKPWFASLGYRQNRTAVEKRQLDKEWEKIKTQTQDEYINGKTNLLVTTKGFGMGIDKPDVRYIIHFGFQGSLESYFQQIGRAGRDRNHSHCILLWDQPTSECNKYLENKNVPECFVKNKDTGKLEYENCPHGRHVRCDYAKQVHFIESGYPSKEELQEAVNYLKEKSNKDGTYPWVYIKRDYLADAVASKLGYSGMHRSQVNERLAVEKLYTLKYVEDFSETYLKISIKRDATMRHYLDTTNSEIVKGHIDLLGRIYNKKYSGYIDLEPKKSYKEFDIAGYIQQVRTKLKKEVLIDEVVQFFNILDERDDFHLKKNYAANFGYEIKLNDTMLKVSVDKTSTFKKVEEWKISQYLMLKQMVYYAELQPLNGEFIEGTTQGCRRANIMQVFTTEGAETGSEVRCDYCDNCGYNNAWEEKANDIVAGASVQQYRKALEDFYQSQSKNNEYLKENINILFDFIDTMFKSDYTMMVEQVSDNWLTQPGESKNKAANLMLSAAHYKKEDFVQFDKHLSVFFEKEETDFILCQEVILKLMEKFSIDPQNMYNTHFKEEGFEQQVNALKIFSSKASNKFLTVESGIRLELIGIQNKKLNTVLSRYEKMEV
jgi:superfamily II DNA helicase RecQ